jgi:iron complex transport system substrate-binding protein
MEDFLAYPGLLNTTKVVRLGTLAEVDTDKVILLKPDVILYSGTYASTADSVQEKTHVPVVCVAAWANPYQNATVQDFYYGLRLTGRILGMDSKAESVITYYQSQLDFVQSRIASIPTSERKTIYLANWATGSGTTYTASKYWPVEIAGGINVAANIPVLYGEVSKEQIMSWNPDFIFIHGFKHKAAATLVLNDTLLQGTNAVKNGNVYGLLGPYIGADPKSWLVDMYMTAITLYPSHFSDITVLGKAHEVFQYVYGDNGATVYDTVMKNRGMWLSDSITP